MNIRTRHLLHLNLNQSKILLSLVKKEYEKSESLNFNDLYYQADLLELLSKLTKKDLPVPLLPIKTHVAGPEPDTLLSSITLGLNFDK